MLAHLALELKDKCSHIIFVDDDRQNFPTDGRNNIDEVQTRSSWELISEKKGASPPSVRLIAIPAGEGEGGTGLDQASMQDIASLLTGQSTKQS